MTDEVGSKVLPCVFWNDVLCSYRKDAKSSVMDRCFVCREYLRFVREMDDEDEMVMDEIDIERKVRDAESSED